MWFTNTLDRKYQLGYKRGLQDSEKVALEEIDKLCEEYEIRLAIKDEIIKRFEDIKKQWN